MKLTNVKSLVTKSLTVGLLAGAFVLAAPAKANAQVAIGVQFGAPVYDGYNDYYARQRWEQYRRQQAYEAQQEYARQQAWAQHEAWERHEAIERREAWERQQAYGNYGYAYGDRDRRDHGRHHDRDDDDDR